MKKLKRPKFRAAGIAGVVTGLVLAVVGLAPTTAQADPPEDTKAQNCESALQGDTDPQLVLTTDPAAGPVAVGDEIDATLTWGTAAGNDVWASIDKIYICMTVNGVVDEASIFEEKPGVDDGTASTTFTVPEGATTVCVNGRVSGNPGPNNSTDSTHKSAQTCFPVGDDGDVCEGVEGVQTDPEDCDVDDVCEGVEGVQTDPEDCDVDDVCEGLEGVQTDPAECEDGVLPSTDTKDPADPADPAAPATEVLGSTTLPRTGAATAPLAALAVGLIGLGWALTARSRKLGGETR